MKRTNQSDCLLCKTNNATQKNSHILPKFVGKTILGAGNAKRGYLFKSSDPTNPEISQDTDKEDFILCPDCEKYFSYLESYVASSLHNRIRNSALAHEFVEHSHNGIKWKECIKMNEFAFRLFIYSIVWRCSVSSVGVWSEFKLDSAEESLLHSILVSYKHIVLQDCSSICLKGDEASIPFVFLTAEDFDDKTENAIFANPSSVNPYHFGFNEYSLFISFNSGLEKTPFVALINSGLNKIKVGFLTKDLWSALQKAIFKRAANGI